MKKILFAASAAAVLSMAVACQPEVIRGGYADKPITEAELSSAFVIDGQYADEACTIPQTDGNYILYHTSPAVTVQVAYVKGSSESTLCTGASGVFYLYPKRKASPNQTFTIKAINQDGTITKADKNVTVYVPTKLKPEYELLLTDAGVQSWTWNKEVEGDGWFYGEGGNTGAGTDFTANNFDGAWWGAYDTESFASYKKRTASGEIEGDQDEDAYMTLDEEGNSVVYTSDGVEIRRGGYELVNWDPDRTSEWEIGNFNTTGPCTLFPYCIHYLQIETSFQLMYLDGKNMAFADPESSEAGDWDNITYWMFAVKE